MSEKKIIDGLKDAIAGNFRRVTIEGQTWVRVEPLCRDDEEAAKVLQNVIGIARSCFPGDTDLRIQTCSGTPSAAMVIPSYRLAKLIIPRKAE